MVSVGKNNWYGHPNKEVLNKLQNSKVYRKEENVALCLELKMIG